MKRVLLVLLFVSGCGDFQEGVAVTVRSEVQPLTSFTSATLSISSVSLLGCHRGTGSAGGTLLSLVAGGEQDLGRFNPPAGEYCELELRFGPADESSAALPREERDAVLGTTLRLIGANVQLVSAEATSVRLPVNILLDETHREAGLTLSIDAPRALEGVDLAAPDAASKLLERLTARVALLPAN
jgi:hypothetical protein